MHTASLLTAQWRVLVWRMRVVPVTGAEFVIDGGMTHKMIYAE